MKSSALQNPWLQILLMLLAIVVGSVYYSQIEPPGYVAVPPKGSTDGAFLKFQTIRFDFDSLESANGFASLKTYRDYPVQPGGVGRDNIFAP